MTTSMVIDTRSSTLLPSRRNLEVISISDDEEDQEFENFVKQSIKECQSGGMPPPGEERLDTLQAREWSFPAPDSSHRNKRQKLNDGASRRQLGRDNHNSKQPNSHQDSEILAWIENVGHNHQQRGNETPSISIHATSGKATSETKTTKQKAKQAPYYFDHKLNVTFYRGAGYEQYPVVLGTVPGHQEICDRWDAVLRAKEARVVAKRAEYERASRGRPWTFSRIADLSSDDGDESEEVEKQCLTAVRTIFPQIQHAFVLQKIQARLMHLDTAIRRDLMEQQIVNQVLEEILEERDYPKELNVTAGTDPSSLVDDLGVTITWNREILKDHIYLNEAVLLIATHSKHVPTHYISKIVHEKKSIFDTLVHLQEVETNYYSLKQKPYNRHRHPRLEIEKKYLKKGNGRRDERQYASMINELQAARQHLAREARRFESKKAKEKAEEENLTAHKARGEIIECQCCFDDEIPVNRAIACQSETTHLFCHSCVARLAENQVGLMKFEMLCMHHSGCVASLSQEGIAQAVPIKILDRLALNQQQAELEAANIEGLEQCPFCDYKAICDPVDVDPIFDCQNPDCLRSSCRKCHENSHVPQTCEEFKSDKKISARHLIEEARSEAMMRSCPKCQVKIVKEFGCNKMQCTKCSCLICYVCKSDITHGKEAGYEHFNKAGAKCLLYDKQGVDRHQVEADEAEIEAIKKAKAVDSELDEVQLQVDTGPGQKRKRLSSDPTVIPPDQIDAMAFAFGANHRMVRAMANARQNIDRHDEANRVPNGPHGLGNGLQPWQADVGPARQIQFYGVPAGGNVPQIQFYHPINQLGNGFGGPLFNPPFNMMPVPPIPIGQQFKSKNDPGFNEPNNIQQVIQPHGNLEYGIGNLNYGYQPPGIYAPHFLYYPWGTQPLQNLQWPQMGPNVGPVPQPQYQHLNFQGPPPMPEIDQQMGHVRDWDFDDDLN